MSNIDFPELITRLASVAGKRLDDKGLPTSLTAGELPGAATVKRGSLSAVFGLAVDAEVELFNGDDHDLDGIVGAKPAVAPTTGDWRPQLEPVPGVAWLKYALTARASAKGSASIGTASGGISGDRQLRVLCYRRHPTGDKVGKSIAADLLDLQSPLLAADIQSLQPHEATALKIRGKLAATITLSWADIFSSSLRQLAGLSRGLDAGPVLVNVGANASAAFTITVEDDFTLCFVRQPEDELPFRVAMRKSARHDSRFQAGAKVEVAFADPAAVSRILTQVMEGFLNVSDGTIAALDGAGSIKALPAQYRPALEALARYFDVADADPVTAVNSALATLGKKLQAAVDSMAKAKVELGFRYEYMRIGSEASLIELSLSEEALKDLHSALVAFDFAKVLAYGKSGMALSFFLHQKTIERVQAWGLSLGLGSWLSLVSKQERRHLFVTREYITSQQQLDTRSYTGSTCYKASVNTWNTEYGGLLKADREEAHLRQDTSARDFKCALQLWWEESKLKLPASLDRIVDDAVLWGVINAQQSASTRQRLASLASGDCKARLSIQISDYGVQQAISVIGAATDHDWGRHAARALPLKSTMPARATCAVRELMYGPVFERLSGARHATGSALEALIVSSLRKVDAQSASKEANGNVGTLYRVLINAGLEGRSLWARWDALREGATRLGALLQVRGEWTDFRDNFNLIAPVLEQTYLIRVVASLLAEQLPGAVQQGRGYSATLTIEPAKASGNVVMIGH